MIARSFLGTLAALGVVHLVATDRVAAAWWLGVAVLLASALETVVGLVRRKLAGGAPRGPR